MKRFPLIFLLVILVAGCNRAASSPPATQPALNFPTPNPSSLPPCLTTDLATSANFNIENGDIVMGVTLTNKSKNRCTLSNPPQVSLLEGGKIPLDLKSEVLEANQTPAAPTLLQLQSGDSAIASVNWHNYCQAQPADGLSLRLTLADGQNLDVKLDLPSKPNCAAGQQVSTLLVVPYSYPP